MNKIIFKSFIIIFFLHKIKIDALLVIMEDILNKENVSLFAKFKDSMKNQETMFVTPVQMHA
jgi:hypothetical protein